METYYYLSSLPGVGKTKIAVEYMRKHLREGSGYIIYVAPTLLLLQETKWFLTKDLSDELASKVRLVVADSTHATVSDRIANLLTGSTGFMKGRKLKPLQKGSVILMTHQGFMSLSAATPDKDKIQVIFDEARKFTAELQPIELKSKTEAKLLANLIRDNSSPLLDASGEPTGFLRFSLDRPPAALLKKMTDSVSGRSVFSPLREVIDRACNKQTDVYVKTMHTKKNNKTHFYEVVMPSRVFNGYRGVILISAFLEDTQMWHLMQGHVNLKELWHHPDFTHIKSRVVAHTEKILTRFARLCIVPMSEQNTVVSLTRLTNSVLVPTGMKEEVQAALEKTGIKSLQSFLDVVRSGSLYELTDAEKEAIKILKAARAKKSPLKWYLEHAVRFVRTLKREGKVKGKVLGVMNETHQHMLAAYPWIKQIPTVSHGLNQFLTSNVLVFMAAINPKPSLIALYRALLPNYDWKRDYLADTVAQSVTRLCVRDVHSDITAYVIVPDSATADLLRAKLMNRPPIVWRGAEVPYPDKPKKKFIYTALTSVNPERKIKSKLSSNKTTNKTFVKNWLERGNNRAIQSLRTQRSIYKKRLSEGKKGADKKLVEIEKKLEVALRERETAEA